MANLMCLGIALVVILVILVDSKSLQSSKSKVVGGKTASSKTAVHKTNTALKASKTKASSPKTPGKNMNAKTTTALKASKTKASSPKSTSKNIYVKTTTAHKASSTAQTSSTQKTPATEAPVQIAPVQNASPQNVATPAFDPSIFGTLLNNPQVSEILTKMRSGGNLTASDMIPVMLVGLQSGLQTTNPALNSLSKTVNETAMAVSASKDGKLSTGQMMIYSNKILTALGNATETPKENMSKLKACMASGMRKYTSMDTQLVFLQMKNCSIYFGNGTTDGDAGVLKLLSVFLPSGVGDLVQSPVALGAMNMVSDIVSQAITDTAGREGAAAAVAAAPALLDTLDAMAAGAKLNFSFKQIFAGFGFGR